MNILLLHNRYRQAGGEDNVVKAEKALLEDHGHHVYLLEISNDDIQSSWDKLKAAFSAIYSRAGRRQVQEAIAQFKPDIVHVHNFFPLLSPSVYDACRAAQVPVVQTLHNYRLLCPKATFFREGQVCERCLHQAIPFPSIQYRCYRDSRLQSIAVAAMLTWHRWKKTWQQQVDAYIVFTQFQRQKMIDGGFPAEKIYLKPNFVEHRGGDRPLLPRNNFLLFVGRLSEEKGCSVLIDAYIQGNIQIPLKIVGDGPLKERLQQQVETAGYSHLIKFYGFCDSATVRSLMTQAQILVFPSTWYEGFPLTLVEAFSCGLAAIVPRLGGLPEIVENQVTGLHFEAGNVVDLANRLKEALADPSLCQEMGENAFTCFKERYQAQTNYQKLLDIYHATSKVQLHITSLSQSKIHSL